MYAKIAGLLILLLSTAGQLSAQDSIYTSETFSVMVPDGWLLVDNPEEGIEYGVVNVLYPEAKWLLHVEPWPKNMKFPDDSTARTATRQQFDNLIRLEHPEARLIEPPNTPFRGRKVMNLFYEMDFEGTPINFVVVYLFEHNTAYVMTQRIPRVHADKLADDFLMLDTSFTPLASENFLSPPLDSVVVDLRSDLALLGASLSDNWRTIVRKVYVRENPLKPQEITLVMELQLDRATLPDEYESLKMLLPLVARGEDPDTEVTEGTVMLMEYAGQFMGAAGREVINSQPPVTYLSLVILDISSNEVGIISIATADLMRFMTEDVGIEESAGMFLFN